MSGQPVTTGGAATATPPAGVPGAGHRPRWQPRHTDLLVGVLYGLTAAGLGVLSRESPHTTPWAALLGCAAVGLVLLVLHRRFPTHAFITALLLALVSLAVGSAAETVLVGAALLLIGVTRSARTAWLSLAAGLATAAAGALLLAVRFSTGPSLWGITTPARHNDFGMDWVNSFVLLAVPALLTTLVGLNVGHRRRFVASLRDRAAQLERERDQQAELIGAEERERIAREMHDVIAHSLAVMIALADGAYAASSRRPAEAQQAIGRVSETGRRTLQEVRRLLGAVRGEEDDPADFLPPPDATALPALVAEFAAAGLPVRLEVAGPPSTDPGLGLTVYRVVQESLTNVLRHGRDVRDVVVRLAWQPGTVRLLVEDVAAPATPHPPGPTLGRGLRGIRERAALYQGTVDSGPRPDGGWRVAVTLHGEDD